MQIFNNTSANMKLKKNKKYKKKEYGYTAKETLGNLRLSPFWFYVDQDYPRLHPWINSTYVTVIDISQIESPSFEYLQIRPSEVNNEN